MAVVAKKAKPRGRGKWMALGVVALAGFLAVETGWAGFGWAQLKSAVYPSDTGLLGWVPGDTGAVVIVDPHQLDLKALGAPGSPAREAIDRTRADVKAATGIDIAFDVDKLLLSPSLAVAHGRFDQKKLTERLTEHRYALAEHKGETFLARPGEDAIAVIDGSVLLYGDEASIKAAIDAHQGDTSLEKSAEVKARLSQVGWNHPVLATVRITDDKPSLRAILTGSTGPRAVTVGVSTLGGLDGDAIVEAASPSAAAELAKLLEEKRKEAGALAPAPAAGTANPPAQPAGAGGGMAIVADVARKATLTTDAQTSTVKIHAHVDPAQLDTLVKNAKEALPLVEAYKTMRLFQLLVPSG